jgi:hypothetical protein
MVGNRGLISCLASLAPSLHSGAKPQGFALIATWAFAVGLAVVTAAAPKAAAQASGLSADIDPGDCEAFIGASDELKSENANVAANARWIIAECHIKLSPNEVADAGGPFREAQHFWDFDCSVGLDDATVDDVPAIVSHAVLTPRGNLNMVCVAPYPLE